MARCARSAVLYPEAVRLVASYPTRAALATDVREQFGRGGLLVRCEVPAGTEMGADVELAVSCDGASATVSARVLQMFAGLGVAVAIDEAGRAQIEALTRETTQERERVLPGAAQLEKIQQALKGDRDARMAILRSPNRPLHLHVLRNPGLTLDEISQIARMTTVSVDVLRQIAERREWGHRPEIAIALIRNPTVPPPVAIALLAYVSEAELRQLAKDSRTREPIQRAARKRLLG
jgi:hypothetical protein